MDIVNIIGLLNQGQIFKYRTKRAILNITGPDARDFLQRMSTNDIALLGPENPLQSCFLNNKGRIVDCITIFQHEEQTFSLVSSFAHSKNLLEWLEQFHFVENLSFSIGLEHAEYVIQALNVENYFDVNFVLKLGSSDYPTLGDDFFETLRIQALIPESNEIALGLMPQNVGLAHTICEKKGCYLGQEVIAKAFTYQKHVKKLAGARLSLENYMQIRIGDSLCDDEGRLGLVSSRSPCYVPGFLNALVVVDEKIGPQNPAYLPAEFIFTKNSQVLA